MDDQLTINDLVTSIQSGINLRAIITIDFISLPVFGLPNRPVSQLMISAHDRAPQVTSQIDFRSQFLWRGKVSTQGMKVQVTIVIEINELTSPRPAGLGHHQRRWL